MTFKQHFLDPVAFANEELGFYPDATQTEMLRTTARRLIVNCSRQWGKSTVTAIKAIHRAMFSPDSLILIVSPSGRQSAEFLRKLETLMRRLKLKPKGDGDNETSLLFPNGSRIVGLPNSEDKIRGFSAVSHLIIDEASRVENSVYDAVRPMLAVAGSSGRPGDLWLLSTPNGRRGFFYDTWAGNDSVWRRVRVPASECPRISQEFLSEQKKTTTSQIFKQEYECEFIDPMESAFRDTWLELATTPDVPLLFRPDPPSPNLISELSRCFFVGLDLGKFRDHAAIAIVERCFILDEHRDPATYAFKSTRQFRLRHLERIPLGTSYTQIIRHVRDLSQIPLLEGRCSVVVDASGVGAPVVELLRNQLNCPLEPVTITSGRKSHRDSEGWFTPRRELIEQFALNLEQGHVRIAANLPHLDNMKEELRNLSQLTCQPSTESVHDDLAIAAALAVWKAAQGRKSLEPQTRLL